jgi:hypothetical protein
LPCRRRKPSSVNVLTIHLCAENNRDNANKKDRSLSEARSTGPVCVLLLLLAGATQDLHGLGTVPYAQGLVRTDQVLLDGGFGEVETLGYLGVGESFGDEL